MIANPHLNSRSMRRLRAATVALAAAALFGSAFALADTAASVNRARASACGRAAGLVPLHETRELDGAARALARGSSLHEAIAALPIRPSFAASVHLAGVAGDSGVAAALAHRACGDLGRAELRELGVAWSGSNLYVIVVAPLPIPAAADRARIEREVLARVNAARATPRRCGAAAFAAVAPLALSDLLSRVAAGHSQAMGARDELAHRDPDGSTAADRVRRSGYSARVVGENIAAGVPSAAEVVDGWLASPGHCANIMDGRFTEMGVAYVVAPHSGGAIYWTQVFAARRS